MRMCKTRIMSLKKNISEDSRSGGKKHIAPVVTAGFLGTTGVLHFAKPEHYDAIVPHALPGSARFYTYASGAAEIHPAGAAKHLFLFAEILAYRLLGSGAIL